MLVATAGHVDHGKTSLIRHLTGVDTDRLEEEKRRGLTIDLGFAYRPVDEQTTLGFIDVPGHSRFINTMIAGVSGIDLGMLIVAADDGPMPQTREHLAVMRLLGVSRFIVVLTKTDRVEPHSIEQCIVAVRALVPECLRVFPVSNTNRQGIAELQTWLDDSAVDFQRRNWGGNFRLPVDRAFKLKGVGLVVTGTVASGRVSPGDELEMLPGGGKVRVRSLRVQDRPTECGRAGDRCAMNIVGDHAGLGRGYTLATIDSLPCSKHLDASFSLLPDAPHALKHLTPVKLYIGTRRLPARLYFIQKPENSRLDPGGNALVQLILEESVSCCRGDRYLIRDDSESITLGGGEILDPTAPRVGKSRQHRLDFLAAMQQASNREVLGALLVPGAPAVNLSRLTKSLNLLPEELDKLIKEIEAVKFEAGSVRYAVATKNWNQARQTISTLVQQWHADKPQEKGIAVLELQALFVRLQTREAGDTLFKPVVTSLLGDNNLSLNGGLVTAPNHRAVLSATVQAHWDKIWQNLHKQKVMIPSLSDLAAAVDLTWEQVQAALQAAARVKLVHKINDARFGLAEHLLEHARITAELAEQEGGLTVINYKNRIGSGRKLAIDILEYFDSLRYTRREGDRRIIIDATIPEQLFAR